MYLRAVWSSRYHTGRRSRFPIGLPTFGVRLVLLQRVIPQITPLRSRAPTRKSILAVSSPLIGAYNPNAAVVKSPPTSAQEHSPFARRGQGRTRWVQAILAERTGRAAEAVTCNMERDLRYDARQALAYGLVEAMPTRRDRSTCNETSRPAGRPTRPSS